MMNSFEDENGEYLVLVNDEGQYSLWPAFREAPAGWTTVGPRGDRPTCLHWIEANWTDMRPTSLVERGCVGEENAPQNHRCQGN